MQNKKHNIAKSNARLISIAESATDSIIVANQQGKIILWNKAAKRMFGYSSKEAIGKELSIIIPEEHRSAHNKGLSRFIQTGEKKVMGNTIEITAQKLDGTKFPVELSLSSWEEYNEVFVCGIIRDISVRKANEKIIKNSLREKEILLKELHHRVKNNLQIVISLLKLYSQNVPEESLQVFKECQDKIHSMALVHSSIYLSNDFENVDLSEYTSSFCNYFFELIGPQNTKVSKELNSITIEMEKAVNFGLILSELLTNSYKYTIQTTPEPEIMIRLTEQNDMIVFQFGDNGPGISEAILNNKEPGTYGLEMVKDLVEQMDGTCDIICDKGTNYIIKLPKLTSNKS